MSPLPLLAPLPLACLMRCFSIVEDLFDEGRRFKLRHYNRPSGASYFHLLPATGARAYALLFRWMPLSRLRTGLTLLASWAQCSNSIVFASTRQVILFNGCKHGDMTGIANATAVPGAGR